MNFKMSFDESMLLDSREDILFRQLGQSIRKLREDSNLSQRSLAEKANVSQSYLDEMERGCANPTWSKLRQVCFALDSSLKKLLFTTLFQDTSTSDVIFLKELSAMIDQLISDIEVDDSNPSNREIEESLQLDHPLPPSLD